MRMTYVLCFVFTAFSLPAVAADQNLKQEVEKIGSTYAESFNKKDFAGIAALYAKGGMHVTAAGPRTDIEQFYEGASKAGFDHEDTTLTEVWPLGADAALAMGNYRLTGKNQSGAPMEIGGVWTAVDVREDGKLKIRMLSAIPKPPPAPK